MPLKYDVRRVKDHERKLKDPHLSLVLNILVEHALFYRLSSITKKNVEELWYRLRVLDLACLPRINIERNLFRGCTGVGRPSPERNNVERRRVR